MHTPTKNSGIKSTMQALQFSETGSLDALKLANVPVPQIHADEVLVEVHAAGVNPSDIKNVLGRFPYTTVPRIPGRDFSGVVVEGPQEWVGQAVWGSGKSLGFTDDGSHAEYLLLPSRGLSRKPQTLSFAQAASCGVPYITAWDALDRTQVGKGTRVVVIGAAGAVGSAAIALARWRGAEVIAAVRNPEQLATLQTKTAKVIHLNSEFSSEFSSEISSEINAEFDLAKAVQYHFPQGADVIFDTTGVWLPPSIAALANFGRLAVIAAPIDGMVQLPVLNLYRRGGSIVGVNSLLYSTAQCADILNQLRDAFDQGEVPAPENIHERSFYEGLDVYREINAGSNQKTVLVMRRED